jgi:hypothetical protein
MRQNGFVFFLLLCLLSCYQREQKTNKAEQDIVKTNPVVKQFRPKNELISIDSLIWAYIKHSDNALVAQSRIDLSVHEEALFDQEIKTDSANYLVYNIGHDLRDDDAQRFVSDSWIYVDTLKRRIFEYTPDEKLVEWKH